MSRIDELYIKNDDDYMLMSGNNIDCLFLFVHGYGSSPLDLLPLANQINSKGHACALMLLSGHGRDGQDIVGHSYSQWENELLNAIRYYKQTYSNIYLIGFSLGATLCLDVSARGKVSGVIGISTFLDLKSKTAKLVLRACDLLGIKMVPRYLQSTSNKTKSEVDNPKELPTLETKLVLKDARRLLDIKKNIGCDSLLFHSIDDKVSDYSKVRELRLRHSNLKLITLRGLNHLIQFDIPQPAIGDVILEYFFPSNEGTDDQSQLAKDIFSQISVEFNHWSGLLFKLIGGFFTIFGALVYFSLENILLNKSSAPYYLTSYSIVNCLFVVLAAMYFFYINRANAYMKQQIEPL